jgi:hypothetical protein
MSVTIIITVMNHIAVRIVAVMMTIRMAQIKAYSYAQIARFGGAGS